MKKTILLKLKNTNEEIVSGEKRVIKGEVFLTSLIESKRKLGQDLFSVNVRKYLSNEKPTAEQRKRPVFKGIMTTLDTIRENPSLAYKFSLNNNGCAIMAKSARRVTDDTWELTMEGEYNGIGNGQQTIYISEWCDSNKPINPNITISTKIMIGFSDKENIEMCEALNTSNKIDAKDIMTTNWRPLHNKLREVGIELIYKKGDKRMGDNIINLNDKGLYNAISSYFTNKPWVTGGKVTDILDVSTITPKSLIEATEIKREIDSWFNSNVNKGNELMSVVKDTSIGYVKNYIISFLTDNNLNTGIYDSIDNNLFKDYVKEYGLRSFIELSFNCIMSYIINFETKEVIHPRYFTNKSKYEIFMIYMISSVVNSTKEKLLTV